MSEKNSTSETEQPISQSAPEPEQPAAVKTLKPKFPNVGDLFAMLGIFLVANVIAMLLALAFGFPFLAKDGVPVPPAMLGKTMAFISLVLYSVTFAGILIYRRLRGGQVRIARFSRRGLNPILLLWGVVFMLSTGVVAEPLLHLLPAPPLESLGRGIWTMLTVVVVAPVFEELICRGVVLESLRSRYGVVVAWFASSLFFAVMHGHPMLVVNAFFLGLVLAFIYLKSDSLYAVMILHGVNNALSYLLMISGHGNVMLSDFVGSQTLYLLIYAGALTVCAASGYMVYQTLVRLKEEEKKKEVA
ncbi:MAG: type II CAAX endopeptidase family protein [Alistipes sp.]